VSEKFYLFKIEGREETFRDVTWWRVPQTAFDCEGLVDFCLISMMFI